MEVTGLVVELYASVQFRAILYSTVRICKFHIWKLWNQGWFKSFVCKLNFVLAYINFTSSGSNEATWFEFKGYNMFFSFVSDALDWNGWFHVCLYVYLYIHVVYIVKLFYFIRANETRLNVINCSFVVSQTLNYSHKV